MAARETGSRGCRGGIWWNRWESSTNTFGCYMVKPHGQLVSVSFIHYWTSTPDLSTSWSSTDLQRNQVPGETLSWEGLPA